MNAPLTGPLHRLHTESNAKMADFSGWSMPVEYPGGGVLAEHTATRNAVGVFDVSHLGKARVAGPGAAAFVNSCFSNDLNRIAPGKAQYTLCCNEEGGVVDDLIAYLRGEDEVFLVPNAANTAEVVRMLEAQAPEGIEITDMHKDYAVIAVQGPRSAELLTSLGISTELEYMSFTDAEHEGAPLTICRTGYTGEKGYELLPTWDGATALWTALVDGARALGGLPAGLGARDTLRTEMGYALHGHELSLDITPLEAKVGWAVGWKKDAFWGKDVLTAKRAAKDGRRLNGLLVTGRGVPRGELDVLVGEDVVGRTTSGTFSPTLKQGIALALLDQTVAEGAEVDLDIRGRRVPATVTKPPFVEDHVR